MTHIKVDFTFGYIDGLVCVDIANNEMNTIIVRDTNFQIEL